MDSKKTTKCMLRVTCFLYYFHFERKTFMEHYTFCQSVDDTINTENC